MNISYILWNGDLKISSHKINFPIYIWNHGYHITTQWNLNLIFFFFFFMEEFQLLIKLQLVISWIIFYNRRCYHTRQPSPFIQYCFQIANSLPLNTVPSWKNWGHCSLLLFFYFLRKVVPVTAFHPIIQCSRYIYQNIYILTYK